LLLSGSKGGWRTKADSLERNDEKELKAKADADPSTRFARSG